MIIVLVLGIFALMVLKNFISKLPTGKNTENKLIEETPRSPDEEEVVEMSPRLELNKHEAKSQKEQHINEINEAIMAAPEEAAKLLTSFIKE